MKEPSLSEDWSEKMVKEVKHDQKRKVSYVNSPVRLSRKSLIDHRNSSGKFKVFYAKVLSLK